MKFSNGFHRATVILNYPTVRYTIRYTFLLNRELVDRIRFSQEKTLMPPAANLPQGRPLGD